MPQPFNYALNIPNPAESVMSGVRDAVGLAGVMSARKLAEEQALEKQAAREKKAAIQAELSQLSEDASPAAIQKFMIRNPDMAKDMSASLKAVSEGRRQADLGVVSQAYAALSSGNTDAAMTVLEQDAAARRNSGDEEGAKRAEAMAETIKINPKAAMAPMGIYVASVMGPDKFVENYSGMQGAQFEAELQSGKKALLGAQVSKAGSEAKTASAEAQNASDYYRGRVAETAAKTAKAQREAETVAPKLSVNMEKTLTQATDAASESRNQAAIIDDLASRWEVEKPTPGLFGSAQSMWNKMLGSDNGLRDLRMKTTQVLNSEALKYLPPGPATDKDVSLAREGVPANTDDPALISDWLKAQARNQRRVGAFNEFKAEWISAHGNPGQATADANIGGIEVKKGESLGKAAKRFMKENEASVSGGNHGTEQSEDHSDLWGG